MLLGMIGKAASAARDQRTRRDVLGEVAPHVAAGDRA
jgi:hypothetical protein